MDAATAAAPIFSTSKLRVLLFFPAVVMTFIVAAYALYAWLRPGRAMKRRPRPAAFNVITSASSLLDTHGNTLTPWTGSRPHAPKLGSSDSSSDPEGWFNLLLVLTGCYVVTAAYYNRLNVGHWMLDHGTFLFGLAESIQVRECETLCNLLCAVFTACAARRTSCATSPSSLPSTALSHTGSSASSSRACRRSAAAAPRSSRCRPSPSSSFCSRRCTMRTGSASGHSARARPSSSRCGDGGRAQHPRGSSPGARTWAALRGAPLRPAQHRPPSSPLPQVVVLTAKMHSYLAVNRQLAAEKAGGGPGTGITLFAAPLEQVCVCVGGGGGNMPGGASPPPPPQTRLCEEREAGARALGGRRQRLEVRVERPVAQLSDDGVPASSASSGGAGQVRRVQLLVGAGVPRGPGDNMCEFAL